MRASVRATVAELDVRPLLVPQQPVDERAARDELRRQVADLERRLSDAVCTAFPHGGVDHVVGARTRGPRLLTLGQLERLRDDLADRLHATQAQLEARGAAQAAARLRLEAMLLAPGRHRFEQVERAEIGEPGCGAYQVRPRLGIIGMLAGWWHVKLSSGCPLGGPPRTPAPGGRPSAGPCCAAARDRAHEPRARAPR